MTALSDMQLMIEVRDGDLDKLGVLFERHHLRLFNFFLRTTGNRQAAEDLVQEVFVRMLKYRRNFRGEGDFTAWMFALGRNAATDHFRRAAREGKAPDEPDEQVAREEPVLAALERSQSAELMRAALLKLPPEKREVLVLSRFGRLKYEEMAQILGCSVSAIKTRVHRALKDLRQIYHGEAREVLS